MDKAGAILTVEGVHSHMQILMGFVHCLFISTIVPSEPALAIAAMKELLQSDQVYQKALERLINELILKRTVLERGHQGELFSRILLTLGRDRASVFSNDHEVPIISAKQFLSTL